MNLGRCALGWSVYPEWWSPKEGEGRGEGLVFPRFAHGAQPEGREGGRLGMKKAAITTSVFILYFIALGKILDRSGSEIEAAVGALAGTVVTVFLYRKLASRFSLE